MTTHYRNVTATYVFPPPSQRSADHNITGRGSEESTRTFHAIFTIRRWSGGVKLFAMLVETTDTLLLGIIALVSSALRRRRLPHTASGRQQSVNLVLSTASCLRPDISADRP